MDIHGNVIQEVPYDPAKKDPIYTGPQQVLGPGFAPFKPYLRPPYFYLRVRAYYTAFYIVTGGRLSALTDSHSAQIRRRVYFGNLLSLCR